MTLVCCPVSRHRVESASARAAKPSCPCASRASVRGTVWLERTAWSSSLRRPNAAGSVIVTSMTASGSTLSSAIVAVAVAIRMIERDTAARGRRAVGADTEPVHRARRVGAGSSGPWTGCAPSCPADRLAAGRGERREQAAERLEGRRRVGGEPDVSRVAELRLGERRAGLGAAEQARRTEVPVAAPDAIAAEVDDRLLDEAQAVARRRCDREREARRRERGRMPASARAGPRSATGASSASATASAAKKATLFTPSRPAVRACRGIATSDASRTGTKKAAVDPASDSSRPRAAATTTPSSPPTDRRRQALRSPQPSRDRDDAHGRQGEDRHARHGPGRRGSLALVGARSATRGEECRQDPRRARRRAAHPTSRPRPASSAAMAAVARSPATSATARRRSRVVYAGGVARPSPGRRLTPAPRSRARRARGSPPRARTPARARRSAAPASPTASRARPTSATSAPVARIAAPATSGGSAPIAPTRPSRRTPSATSSTAANAAIAPSRRLGASAASRTVRSASAMRAPRVSATAETHAMSTPPSTRFRATGAARGASERRGEPPHPRLLQSTSSRPSRSTVAADPRGPGGRGQISARWARRRPGTSGRRGSDRRGHPDGVPPRGARVDVRRMPEPTRSVNEFPMVGALVLPVPDPSPEPEAASAQGLRTRRAGSRWRAEEGRGAHAGPDP